MLFRNLMRLAVLGLLAASPVTLAATVTVETTITVTSCTAYNNTSNPPNECPAAVGDEFGVIKFSYDDSAVPATGYVSITPNLIAPTEIVWNGVTYDETNTQARVFDFYNGDLITFSVCPSDQGGCGTGNVDDWSVYTSFDFSCNKRSQGQVGADFRGIGGVFQNGYDLRGDIDYVPGCAVSDSDGDGVNDDVDLCPDTPSGEAVDADGCSASQLDEDGDGVSDALDLCPNTPLDEVADADGCSASQRDSDGDGVNDLYDYCAATAIPEMVPTVRLHPNRWALVDDDFAFDTVIKGKGKGPNRSYTTEDTAGCSCEQIIEAQGLGNGHTYHGCSNSAMDDWVELVTP